ncbi:MAG: protein phosphatase 2C domain-containing protein [Candidatus Andeanibacterium colombiense]|uniref:Protein phosphatase 2C domain-containing protein n=1 Tax=Candidatus Andeanibacterium colombiense TaxID=3121345 RepID=A0AAJ6BPF5_9SPHN|nr:MAG: protein phosphatase 2C domain-containing protein [Sphingomonadaceae bacterium]
MGFDCAIRTHVGLKRKLNEDSVLALTDKAIWAVADGMGGHEAGEVASAKVIEALSGLPESHEPERQAQLAVEALKRVNRDLIELGNDGVEHKTIGSTVVGLAIGDGQYRCFWAGDSRAYRIRDGGIVQISRDHSLVQDLIAAKMIEPEEAETHPNANVITRAVGAAEDLNVDTVGGVAFAGDIFLLGSDGLTRVVSQIEILAALYSKPLEQAADSLLEKVLERGAPDNVSFVIVRVG